MEKLLSRLFAFMTIAALTVGNLIWGSAVVVSAYEPVNQNVVDQIVVQPLEEHSQDGKVAYHKYIEQMDTDKFKITLDLISQDMIEKVEGIGATVVLVLDISGSMGRPDSEGMTSLYHASEAVTKFAEEFLNGSNTNNLLGLVTYDDWSFDAIKDLPEAGGNSLTNDIDLYKLAIDNLEAFDRQTNIQAGLVKARNILEADTSGNPQYIILFSDGSPSHSFMAQEAEPIGNTVITKHEGGGFSFDMPFKLKNFLYNVFAPSMYTIGPYSIKLHYFATISEAIIAKEQNDIDVYSIFFHNKTLSDVEYHQGVFTMTNVATGAQYHEINDVTGLADLFYELEQSIIKKSKLWHISDPMGQFIDFKEFDGYGSGTAPPGAEYDNVTKTLNWNLLDPSIVPQSMGNNKYKYSLSYIIELDSHNLHIENGKAYPTNGTTTLNYFLGTDINTGEKKQVEFSVPLIRTSSDSTNYLNVYPMDMIAYQGGNSLSGNSFPRPYFTIQRGDGTKLTTEELQELIFYMDDVQHIPGDNEYFIYEYPFRCYYKNTATGKIHNDPSGVIMPDDVGFYNIIVTTKDVNGHNYKIWALDKDNNTIYDFRFSQNARLEVRPQSPAAPTLFTLLQAGTPKANFKAQAPTAFIGDVSAFVNSAGIDISTLFNAPDIRLMADAVMPNVNQGLKSSLDNWEAAQGMEYEAIYLNLVDHADGNIIVKPNKPITVVYPYPAGTGKQTKFKVFHFYNINRASGYDPSFEAVEIAPVNLDYGLAFEVSNFSPFVIAFSRGDYTVQFDLKEGLGRPPLDQYTTQYVSTGSKVTKPDDPYRSGYTFGGWELHQNGVTRLWNFEIDTVNSNIILNAKWIPIKKGGTGGSLSGSRSSSTASDSTTLPELNKQDHFAYMQGYPGGTFKPSASMTRAEAAMMFSRLMLERMNVNSIYPSTFTDVEQEQWYANAVGFLQQRGVIKDTGDLFRPDEPITRAEFAVFAAGFESSEKPVTSSVFKDVPMDHWAAKEISLAVDTGWAFGYLDGTFRPEQSITRAEVVTIANRVLERNADKDFIDSNRLEITKFSDLEENYWAYYEIMEATNGHFFTKQGKKSDVWISLKD